MFCGENAFAFYNIASAQEGSKEWLEVLTCEQAGWPYYLFIIGLPVSICFDILVFQFCILIY